MALQLYPYTFEEVTGDATGRSNLLYAAAVLGGQVEDVEIIDREEREIKMMEEKIRIANEQISSASARQEKDQNELRLLAKKRALVGTLIRMQSEFYGSLHMQYTTNQLRWIKREYIDQAKASNSDLQATGLSAKLRTATYNFGKRSSQRQEGSRRPATASEQGDIFPERGG